jgi:phenylalanyl-tRNA synthetase beta chain
VGDHFNDNRFHQLLGVVTDLLAHLGAAAPGWEPALSVDIPAWAHPARCLAVRVDGRDEPLARVASLEPGLARAIGLADELTSDVAVAEVSIDALVESDRSPRPYQPIPRYPGVKLDVAVDLPEATHAAELVGVIERSGKGQVASTELFDVYRGKNVETGRKSLAYHIVLRSEKKTLTDKDQAKFLTRLENGLEGLNARLRR